MSNVEDMYFMFSGCFWIKSLDLQKFDTSKVTDMCHLFEGCCQLASLDLSKFKTNKVKDMAQMFAYDYNLVSIIGLDKFDTS